MAGAELDTKQPALTQVQRSVLGAIWTYLLVHGRWPTFSQIDRELYRTLDAEVRDVLPEIPDGMLFGVAHGNSGRYIEDSREIGLTVAAITELGVGTAELSMFLHLVQLAVDLERAFEPAQPDERPQLTAQRAAEHLGIARDDPDGMLSRLASILYVEPWGWNSVGEHSGGSWSFQIGSDVRRFRRVQTISEYWDIRPKYWHSASTSTPPFPDREVGSFAESADSPISSPMPFADLAQVIVAVASMIGGLVLGWAGVQTGACIAGAVASLGLIHARRRGQAWTSAHVMIFLALLVVASALFMIALFRP